MNVHSEVFILELNSPALTGVGGWETHVQFCAWCKIVS